VVIEISKALYRPTMLGNDGLDLRWAQTVLPIPNDALPEKAFSPGRFLLEPALRFLLLEASDIAMAECQRKPRRLGWQLEKFRDRAKGSERIVLHIFIADNQPVEIGSISPAAHMGGPGQQPLAQLTIQALVAAARREDRVGHMCNDLIDAVAGVVGQGDSHIQRISHQIEGTTHGLRWH